MSYMEFYPSGDVRDAPESDRAPKKQAESKALPVSITLPAVASSGFATTAILKK